MLRLGVAAAAHHGVPDGELGVRHLVRFRLVDEVGRISLLARHRAYHTGALMERGGPARRDATTAADRSKMHK